MVFFSFVGDIASSIVSTVSSVASSLANGVGSISRSIGAFCAEVAPKILDICAKIPGIVGTICKVASLVLQIFEIFSSEENVEGMGERALQASESGITPEGFDDFDQYMQALREFDIDPEKAKNRPFEQKFTAGLAVGSAGLEAKFDLQTGSAGLFWLLTAARPEFFTPEKIAGILNATHDVPTIWRYFEGKLGISEAQDIRKLLFDIEQKVDPQKNAHTFANDLAAAKSAVQTVGRADV